MPNLKEKLASIMDGQTLVRRCSRPPALHLFVRRARAPAFVVKAVSADQVERLVKLANETKQRR